MKKNLLLLCCLLSFHLFAVNAQSNFIGSGIAMKFSGNPGNYVTMGDAYNDLKLPFSLEMWIMPQSYPSGWGGIFGTDNNASNYYGFYLQILSNGTIELEFGDGLGAGSSDRRGYITSSSVPLNSWTHLAIVCNSVSDVQVYFNGVPQAKNSSGGGATNTQLTHSSAPVSLGTYSVNYFNGQIDEVRLWNVAQSDQEVRESMCKKIDVATAGLIGYWIADESYSSNTIMDYSSSGVNGTILGSVKKITSGAPIGDFSTNVYTSDWSGVIVSLKNLSTGDALFTGDFQNDPYGVQVYGVNAAPYNTDGLNLTPNYYYGVFCANAGAPAKYKIRYLYSLDNGIITDENKSSAQLMTRNDGSVVTWNDLGSTNNTERNGLRKAGLNFNGEFILNVPLGSKQVGNGINAFGELQLSPNPTNGLLNITLRDPQVFVSEITIVDLSGREILAVNSQTPGSLVSLDVSKLNSGIYFLRANTSAGRVIEKFVVGK